MTTWNDHPESLVASLLISYTPTPFADGVISTAFTRAVNAVPHTETYRTRVTGKNKTATLRHAARVYKYRASNGYHGQAQLLTQGDHETHDDAKNLWQWQVGYTSFNPDTFPSTVDTGRDTLLFEVTRFRVTHGALDSAPQLALFRASFLQGLHVLTPDLTIHGRVAPWNRNQWTSTPTAG